MVKVDRLQTKNDYLETDGPLIFNSISDISEAYKSYLLKDAAILKCLESDRAWILFTEKECR